MVHNLWQLQNELFIEKGIRLVPLCLQSPLSCGRGWSLIVSQNVFSVENIQTDRSIDRYLPVGIAAHILLEA